MAASGSGIGKAELKTTGSPKWEAFAKSARQLGRDEGGNYPQLGDPCLLCHRPLDEPSVSLVRRFWSFLDDEARVTAEEANAALNTVVEDLEGTELILLAHDGRMRADLMRVVPSLVRVIDTHSAQLMARRDEIVAFLERRNPSPPAGDVKDIEEAIASCRQTLDDEIRHLEENSVEAALAKHEAAHVLLRHREVLSKSIDDVCAYVESLKWIDKATTAKRSLTTRFVTDKQKDLFQLLIEGDYKDRLKAECGDLDALLPIEFKARGSGGKTIRGLQMLSGHKLHDILSEGEQRAVALADFLTEVNLNPSSAGIVLDDPVTSLDHKRKRRIAARLAREAKFRQVIIFTHDLVFLSTLINLAKEGGIEISTHWVEKGADGAPGRVMLDDCPAGSDAVKAQQGHIIRNTGTEDLILLAAFKSSGVKMTKVRNASRLRPLLPAFATLILVSPAVAQDQARKGDRVTLDEHSLTMLSPDGGLKFNLGGRLHADFGTGSSSAVTDEFPKHSDIRRVWLELKITIYDDLTLNLQYDFSSDTTPINNLLASYKGFSPSP